MGRLIRLLGLAFGLLLSTFCFSQEKPAKQSFIREIGVWSGFGYGNNQKSIPEGNYNLTYSMLHIGCRPFFRGNAFLEQFQIYFEPQYNFVRISPQGAPSKKEHEFGLNIGLKYLYPLTKKFKLFIYIGTGPHSFSATTERQAPGYLFSDNMGMGVYYFLTPKWSVATTFRIRHLSNADTRQPNHGINTDNFLFGLAYHLW